MSRPTNNFTLASSEVRLKIFIKEKNELPVDNNEQSKFKLGFNGIEAKLAYDEIMLLESQRKSLPSNSKFRSNNYNEATNLSNKRLKKINKNVETDVTDVNKLFKAIELADMEYIRLNFNAKNVNIMDQFNWTPLMSAAYAGHFDIVNSLLVLGANLQAKDKSGFTAMDLAAKRNHLHIMNLLKEHAQNNKLKIEKKKTLTKDNANDIKMKNERGFYCNVCNTFFKETSRSKHETSTLHIFNTKPQISNTFYGIPKQNKGYQMLLSSGWNEEGGLGPHSKGHKYPVKTILKRDRKGLGKNDNETARITHFKSEDVDAIRFINRNRKKTLKKIDRKKQLSKDAAKTRALRQALS